MTENHCVVCFKNVRIYSVGECEHPVCYECSTRMRVLCRQNECPMCRHEMSMVVFTEKVRPFRQLKRRYISFDEKHRIAFETRPIEDMYSILLQHTCSKCQKRPVFDSYDSLNDHMKKAHDLFCCDLCADNLKIFPSERRYYSKMELNRHRRIGDVDDRSHRGHPLCEFCNIRYMDRDELYRHLRKIHLFCHICDSEGVQQFYGQYNMLRDHYRKDHFLCEEGDCIQEQLTSVFPSEIDLKAHRALVHCRNLRNKQAVRQARTLELEFNLAPRNRRPVHQENHHENSSASASQNTQSADNNLVDSAASFEQEFPSLTNDVPRAVVRPKIIRERQNRLAFDDQNFPALGSDTNVRLNYAESGPSSASVASANISIQTKSKKVKDKNGREEPLLAIAGPSTSTLSLTWVKKAKQKKPPPPEKPCPTPTSSSHAVPKPPPSLTRKDFPTLQMAVGEAKESPKKNKKSSVAIHIEEDDSCRFQANNNDSLSLSSSSSNAKQKKGFSSNVSRSISNDSHNSKKDDKTPYFLLNASRKKVKMKTEASTPPPNEKAAASQPNAFAKNASNDQIPSGPASGPGPGHSKAIRENKNAIQSANRTNFNCDTICSSNDMKIKKWRSNEKPLDRVPKDAEKKSNNKGKENVSISRKTEDKKDLSASGVSKKDHNQNADFKKCKGVDKVDGVRKKTELNIGPLTECHNHDVAANREIVVRKPPPGLDKPKLPVPPPGIAPIAEDGISNTAATFPSFIANPVLIYQQPENFAARNAELIRKITDSLPKCSDDALNELKNMSLLFREGLLSAANFYQYCTDKFKDEDFKDIFSELIALLPNIPKQQELFTIHAALSNESSLSRLHSCEYCFQILLKDDIPFHQSQHETNGCAPLLLMDNRS